ncbi:YcaO-like family protein, partial [Mobilicoccus massiliensis]
TEAPPAGALDPDLARAAAGVREKLVGCGAFEPGTLAVGVQDVAARLAPPATPLLVAGDTAVAEAIRPEVEALGWDVRFSAATGRAAVNEAFGTRRLLVVLTHGPSDPDLVDVDRWCHDMRVDWLPVELGRGVVLAGPRVTPGEGASYEDLVGRRCAAAYDRRVHRALRTPSLTGDCGPAPADVPGLLLLALMLGARSAGDVLLRVRWESGDPVVTEHPVLPMPGSVTRHRVHRPEDLVDELTGLVVRTRTITHDASVPASLVTRQCDVADIRAVSRWANNTLCQGSVFGDADLAGRSPLGESIERYCANILDTLPVRHASWDELRRRGIPALDPDTLVLYSDRQYAARGFPFVPLTRQTRVHWVPGRSLSRDTEVLVPASLVYVNWYAAGYAGSPLTNFCAFAGIAAGPDLDFAVMSGLEEVVERHATMLWWLSGHVLPGLVATDELEQLWDGTDPRRQRHGLIHIDCDIPVPVVGATVHDDVDRLVNIGFSARHDAQVAAAKAWTEALTLQEGSRDLLRMDGLHWGVMASGELNGRAFKPWRADRAYLDDFRADMHDCDDLMVQQQVYLDPRAAERMRHLLEPPASRPMSATSALSERSLGAYRAAVESAGYEVVVVDLTTPDVASTGMAVVRVLVPGTIGNAPAAFPFLGRGRVPELAHRLGWTDRLLDEDELNHFPMPHA